MRRRGKGEGGLSKRKDGRYQGSYTGSDGRRHYVYAATRRETVDKLNAALRDLSLGVYVAGQSQSVADYITRWLARADHLRPITRKRYESLIRLHVIPHLGMLEMRKVQPQHVADLYSRLKENPDARSNEGHRTVRHAGRAPRRQGTADNLGPDHGGRTSRHGIPPTTERGRQSVLRVGRGSGLKSATIAQLHAVLHSAFDQALRWNMIARNPVAAVKAPKVEQREMRILALSEIHGFLDAVAGDPLEALYVLAVTTGARQGELLALRWQDVDLEAATMTIAATLTRIDGHWERTPPKTRGSVRTVHLSSRAVVALKAHRLRMAEALLPLRGRTEGETLVFLERGAALNGFHVTERRLKPLLRRAGLPVIRFHDLRHVFASLMLSQGVRPDLVAQMLGHSNPATTLRIYAHLMPGDQQAAMRRMDEVLAG